VQSLAPVGFEPGVCEKNFTRCWRGDIKSGDKGRRVMGSKRLALGISSCDAHPLMQTE